MLYVLLLSLLALGPAPPADMVAVGGGTFTPLYSIDGQEVEVQPFLLGRYPVTNAEFLAFVKVNPKWRRSAVKRVFAEANYLEHWTGDLSFAPELKDSPVVNVSWFAARAYCQSKGMRLPTQEEWEFAGRASATAIDATSEKGFRQRILDWYTKPSTSQLPEVGSTFRNVYGAYDMHGLVWEWVDDFNSVLIADGTRSGGELDRNLYCAAGVTGSVDPSDYAAFMRYAFRSSLSADYTLSNLGFRCAADFPRKGPSP